MCHFLPLTFACAAQACCPRMARASRSLPAGTAMCAVRRWWPCTCRGRHKPSAFTPPCSTPRTTRTATSHKVNAHRILLSNPACYSVCILSLLPDLKHLYPYIYPPTLASFHLFSPLFNILHHPETRGANVKMYKWSKSADPTSH
jgi:hypothetical protein